MALSASASVGQDSITAATVIAIDKDKNSPFAVKWAVENLMNGNNHTCCVLVHVQSQNLLPQDINALPLEGRPPTEAELQQFFLPYRGFCARKGIKAKEVVLHDIDIPSALVDYICKNSVTNIVVGASNRNAILRKFKSIDVSASLLKSAPESCSVYVISRGKVQSSRMAIRTQKKIVEATTPKSRAATPPKSSSWAQPSNFPPDTPAENKNSWRDTNSNRVGLGQTNQSKYTSNMSNESHRISADSFPSGFSSHQSSLSGLSDFSGPLSYRSSDSLSDNLEYSLTSETSSKSRNSITHSYSALEAEMRKLKLELKQTIEMYDSACQEAVAARYRARELQLLRTKEEKKLEEAKLAEESAVALAEAEKQKTKTATEAAAMAQRLAEMETQKRKYAEMKAMREEEVKNKAMYALANQNIRCRRYNIEDIEVATDYFNNSNKIGEGGYGPVYKALLDHTSVAIKVLRPDLSQGQKQFQQEVEVLSCIRHPHMVLLLGACPEYGCLVYEYMENGSLEDRLFQKDNTPPIPWKTRFKIASEIATALLFLHQTKPEPLVHRDLKPANILLSRNYVSKISDVGLARLVPSSAADSVTQYLMTAAAGTFCYIDPEYQQTGLLGVKSDIYSLGVMLLQIITGRPPMGLSHQVEQAINSGKLAEIVDPSVTDWPLDEALSFAKLALKCCELRKKDRPDLGSVVVPELNRLRDVGFNDTAASNSLTGTPHQRSNKPVHHLGSTENQDGMKKNPNVEMEFNVDECESNKKHSEQLQHEEQVWKSQPFAPHSHRETRWKAEQEPT